MSGHEFVPVALIKALAIPFVTHREGDYVELEDENEPDGNVLFRRADGSFYMLMSREEFEELRDKI